MSTKPDQLGPLGEIVAQLLNEKRVELGLSYRQLAARMDIPHQTVMRALKMNRYLTIDEMDLMCSNLSLVTSKLVKRAEDQLAAKRLTAPQIVSEPLRTINPEALDLAASRDSRLEESEQGYDQSENLGAP